MANLGERSVNIVTENKPKMLQGLGQQALSWVQGLSTTLSWTPNTTGGQRAPNPFVSTVRNVVSLCRSFP